MSTEDARFIDTIDDYYNLLFPESCTIVFLDSTKRDAFYDTHVADTSDFGKYNLVKGEMTTGNITFYYVKNDGTS